mgnify:CR=1 FL=1|tara:strand:- start:368 stop:586 length:219 start_codon:yes stop_codon:yes gene_type:complete
MKEFTVTVLATIEIEATIEAEDLAQAKSLALDIVVDEHGCGDGVTVSTVDGVVNHVSAFGMDKVIDAEEVAA